MPENIRGSRRQWSSPKVYHRQKLRETEIPLHERKKKFKNLFLSLESFKSCAPCWYLDRQERVIACKDTISAWVSLLLFRHLMRAGMMRKQSEGFQFGGPFLLYDSLAWRFLRIWRRTYSRCRLQDGFRIVTGLNDGILCTPYAVLEVLIAALHGGSCHFDVWLGHVVRFPSKI